MASVLEDDIFQHDKLPDDRKYIRLLQIVSVDEARDIKVYCELTTWLQAMAPEYTAISYTWGDPSLVVDILVNGKRMQVRRNCEDVLRQPCRKNDEYFFWWKKGGHFWIDAICINQTNNVEKSFQVAKMGEVFRKAPRTLACVGRHENESEFLFQMLHQHRVFWERCCTTLGDTEDFPGRLLGILRFESTMIKLLNALKIFLRRSYFYRVWIYQELFFGQDIRLCCEDKSVKLSLLRGLYSALTQYLRHLGLEDYMKSVKSAGSLLDDGVLKKTTGHGLWNIIQVAGQLQCEDIRDRVFGTLSMIDWQSKNPIQPDYDKGPYDLALEVLMRIIRDDHHNNINSVLSDTITIARLMGLPDQNSSVLIDEIQKRKSTRFQAPSVDPMAEDVSLILSEFWGKRLYFHKGSWQIRSHPSRDDFDPSTANNRRSTQLYDVIDIQTWTEGRLWDLRDTSILLPQEVQPLDWVLLPYFTEDISQRIHLAFIAREFNHRQLHVVGKALVNVVRLGWPTKSAWEREGTTLEVFLDPRDAIILAYSCNWRSRLEESWSKEDNPHKVEVDGYFETSLCCERSYSYVIR